MARPRRSTKQELYDQFADFDIADQAVVLEFLEEQHRQNKRTAAKRNGTPEPAESYPERTPGAATILGEPE